MLRAATATAKVQHERVVAAGAPAADILLVFQGGGALGGVAFDVTVRSVLQANGTALVRPQRGAGAGDKPKVQTELDDNPLGILRSRVQSLFIELPSLEVLHA